MDPSALDQWFDCNNILKQYKQIIIENGFETRDLIINNINHNVLQQMNINLLAHRLEIIREIKQLQTDADNARHANITNTLNTQIANDPYIIKQSSNQKHRNNNCKPAQTPNFKPSGGTSFYDRNSHDIWKKNRQSDINNYNNDHRQSPSYNHRGLGRRNDRNSHANNNNTKSQNHKHTPGSLSSLRSVANNNNTQTQIQSGAANTGAYSNYDSSNKNNISNKISSTNNYTHIITQQHISTPNNNNKSFPENNRFKLTIAFALPFITL